MNEEKVKKLILELIEEVDYLGECNIGDYSIDVKKDIDKHKLKIQKYKKH